MKVGKMEKSKQIGRMKGMAIFAFTVCVLMLGCMQDCNTIVAQAAAKTITVNKADTKTAEKVHKYLYKGKELTLKVKGDSQKTKKTIKSLVQKVGVANKYDVVFHYTPKHQSGSYYYYSVSRENAQLYKYSVKTIKKIFRISRDCIDVNGYYKKELQDIATYPDEKERKLRIIYDNLIRDIVEGHASELRTCYGYDKATTVSEIHFSSLYKAGYYTWDLVTKERDDNEFWLYSFDEFVLANDVDKLLKDTHFAFLEDVEKKVMSTPFYKLSDAMKVYVVHRSWWFWGMGVTYDLEKRTTTTGSKGMKYLYNQKASGVCVQFAQYECLLWDQLGITNYYNSSDKISHAWSVVKVKNSKGKTLWIPYDYGMGPSTGLNVRKDQYKYIDTEKKRYKLYLSGIKGAPKKKNWDWDDIN